MVPARSLGFLAAVLVVACTTTTETSTSIDPLNASADDACPAQPPGTGEPTGKEIERDLFGCYGACGPSCKAACVDDAVTITRTLAPAADGTPRCQTCSYKLTSCKSHEMCRWHDDCYRQCDLRWEAEHTEPAASPPWNPCYLTCDNPVAKASLLCGADWTQIGKSTPSIADACWDGSFVAFTTLTAQHVDATACAPTRDARPRPWSPNAGAWSGTAKPGATLPKEYSCSRDTDCPDRNQRCDPRAGSIWGINGPGLCVDRVPSPGVDVTPLRPPGTFTNDDGAPEGAPCSLGFACRSGVCEAGVCVSP